MKPDYRKFGLLEYGDIFVSAGEVYVKSVCSISSASDSLCAVEIKDLLNTNFASNVMVERIGNIADLMSKIFR